MNHGFGWGHDASPYFALNLQKQRTSGPSVPTIPTPFCAPGDPPAELTYWASASLAYVSQSRGDPHVPWLQLRIDNRPFAARNSDLSVCLRLSEFGRESVVE